jgi:iron(III) transport system permease protein
MWLCAARSDPSPIAAALLAAALAWLVLAPIGSMLIDTVRVQVRDSATTGLRTGEWTLSFLQRTFTSRVSGVLFWTPLANTIVVAALVSLIALPLGAGLAWLTVRTDLPGRRFLSSVMVVPYMLPSWTFAVAWLTLFKNRRLGGLPSFAESFGFAPPDWLAYGALPIVICEALHLFPFAFLLFGNALRSVDTQLEESGRVLGASGGVIARRIILPLLRPALLSAFLLIFSRVLGSFGTPYILGSGVKFMMLPTALYGSFKIGSPGVAAVIATVTIALGISLLALDVFFVREFTRFVTMGGKGSLRRTAPLGGLRAPALVIAGAACLITTLLPLASLLASTLMHRPGVFRLDNFTLDYWIGAAIPAMPGQRGLFRNADIAASAWNSLSIAAAAALICGLAGLFVGYLVVRLPNTRLGVFLRQVSFLPYLVPSIGFAAACLSFFAVARGPVPSLYGTMTLLVLVMAVKYLPFASRSGISAMMQMGGEPEEAARVCGAGWLRRLARIVVPIQKHALVAGIVLPFISGMKEQSLVIMLATPGTEVLTTQVLRYVDYGYSQLANAVVLAIVGIVFAFTFLLEKVTGSNLASGVGGTG